MKKSKRYLFLVIFVFFCLTMRVSATTSYVSLKDAVFIREGPGKNYNSYTLGQIATSYVLKNENIVADEAKDGSCDAGWYEIDYEGKSAYVCSGYVNKYSVDDKPDTGVSTTACEKEMEKEGFPASYWSGLCSLKSAHPTWTFKAIQTNLDFVTSVNKFTNCKDALISNPKAEWQDNTCNYSEGSFKPVNQTAVAYYLDPRNFFNDIYIFQFEDNRYNQTLTNQYTNLSKSIINNTQFYKYHLNNGTDMAPLVASGGLQHGVSPSHMAARMYQELGTSNYHKNLYQGTFKAIPNKYVPINPETGTQEYDFRGYYNFYNIGVTGTCVAATGPGATYCGLMQAKNRGWNSVAAAIAGGGEFLMKNYISGGQFTTYLERFNIVPTTSSSMYLHYYMANLQAPTSESSIAYNSYKNANLLESSFVFSIPVYKNMGAVVNNSGNGAVNGGSSSSPSTMEINTIVTSAGYKTSGDYITGINPDTNAKTLIDNIAAVGAVATITNNNNATITSDRIGTGFKVTIKNANTSKTYTVLIKGDASGDGLINAQDLIYIQRHILGTYNLKDAFLKAADASNNNTINAQDLIYVQRHILETYTITQ